MSSKLTLTIGLPGSGKTTWAQSVLAAAPDSTILVSRDDFRQGFYGIQGIGTPEQENGVTKLQEMVVEYYLKQGKHVIVHDMNLRKKYRRRWAEIAVKLDAALAYQDFTQVPLFDCINRDYQRGRECGRKVGSAVIEDLYHKFVKHQSFETTINMMALVQSQTFSIPEPYKPNRETPTAIMVDIDGTVALHEGVRGPYDTSRYHLDKPNRPIIELVQDYAYDQGTKILFCSGRDERFSDVTYEWLMEYVKVPVAGLFMRPANDTRRDDIVKLELFDKHIRDNYNVKFVLDDRNRVVQAWRSIGLTVLQVADGDF